MSELLRWLLIPSLVYAGFWMSKRQRALGSGVACGLGVLCLVLVAALLVSGLATKTNLFFQLHRWTGHGSVIAAWNGGLVSLGVAIEQRAARLWRRVAVLFFSVLFCLFASFSGYLGLATEPNLPIDSYRRFVVLHLCVLPALVALLLCSWVWLFWPTKEAREFPHAT